MCPSIQRHGGDSPPETDAQHDFEDQMAELLDNLFFNRFVVTGAVGRAMAHDNEVKGVEKAVGLAWERQMQQGQRRLERVKKVEAEGQCVPR